MRRSILLTLVCLWLTTLAKAQAPVAAFSADAVAGCSPQVIHFTDVSTGSPTSWLWDFGNGATSTLQNPSTAYFNPGTYTVTLKVTNLSGSNSLTKTNYITVYGNPVVNFRGSDSVGCYPFPVQFTDLSEASNGTTNTAWVWDLGDGTQTTTHNPQQTYVISGNYTVSLKVTNDKGCWSAATKQQYIKINGGVKADFGFVKPSGCRTPFTLPFTNTSSGPGQLSYFWDFGDNTTSTDATPVHSYANEGLYTVSLIAVSSNGCRDTMEKENLLNLQNTSTAFSLTDSACAGNPVAFSNTSSPSPSSTLWLFGDGTTSTAFTPVKSYTAAGTYEVKLLQSYGICTDSAVKKITVSARPTALFTSGKTQYCQPPLNVAFQNSSTDAIAYRWDFGDGSTSTEPSPSHTYTDYGEFTVTLVAINANGCTDSVQKPGLVKIAKPAIVFDSLPARNCAPYTHVFHANINSADPVVSYFWNLGNGQTSTAMAPSATYTDPGTYAVSLTVTTAGGCVDSLSLPAAITVGKKPALNFSAVPNNVCAFQLVQFSSTATEGSIFLWNFGEGGRSDQQNPLYQYTDTGTFSVQLIVDNSGCKDSIEFKDYITVRPPIARFSYQTTCTDKLFFAFKDESIGAKGWQWNFGDGTTSTEQNPQHRYTAYGAYTITLTVVNDSCSHFTQKQVLIVNGTPDFVAGPAAVCQGTPTFFTADTTNEANIATYSWDFGDGSPAGSGRTTSIIYPRAGLYTVTLTVRDVNGCLDTVTKQRLVQINGPAAAVNAVNSNGCKGLKATFNDASRDDGRSRIVKWRWDLGDSTIINNTNNAPVQHTYPLAGVYDVSLTVTDASGCADTLLLPALVRTSDIRADFVSADTISCPGAPVRFSNLSQALPNYTCLWNFGDGSFATGQHPVTAYKKDGVYAVKLSIRDALGCIDSIAKLAYVSVKRPVASFTVNDSASSCIPLKVSFTNTSSYFLEHVWVLNGGTSQLPNPTQYYNQPGVFQTKLIVTSPGGCTDTATRNITVFDPAVSKISYLPLNGCKPLQVDLKTSSPKNMNYIWDFGDGTITSNEDSISRHVYNSFGDFVPKVIMKDAEGCVLPVIGKDTIRILGASAKFGIDVRVLCDSGLVRFLDSTTSNNTITRYQWDFGDGTYSNQSSSVTHGYPKAGSYAVALNVQTINRCVDTFRLTLPVQVAESPEARIAGDSVICVGQGINHMGVLSKPDTSLVRWAWIFPNGNTASVKLPDEQFYNQAGKFVVKTVATNSSGCSDTAWQTIRVNPVPTVTLPSTLTTKAGSPVLIPAVYSDTMTSYQWEVPDGLSCTTCPQPLASPKADTRYIVHFTDRNGCQNAGEVQVIVLCNNDNVFVPNTFSPNGDGSNDVFYVRGKGLSRVKSLRIFNRWGQVVFERANFAVNDASAGWDGKFNGAAPQAGVYVYQVEIYCDNSQVVRFEGNVALLQ